MNIYLITESGVGVCVRAETMRDAVSEALSLYLAAMASIGKDNVVEETDYYHTELLESCKLVGKLVN